MSLKQRVLSVAIAVITGITFLLPSTSFAHEDAGNVETPAVFEPGTILIATDSNKKLLGEDIVFGHAAIVGPEGNTAIQAVGGSFYSEEVPIQQFFDENPHWRAYVVRDATPEQKYAAARYARDYLTGKEYPKVEELLYTKEDPNKLYCSALVWQAWKQVGFDLDYDDGGTESIPSRSIQYLITYEKPWRQPIIFEPFSPTEVDTVFPAEIAQDPALTMIARGKEDGLIPLWAEFVPE